MKTVITLAALIAMSGTLAPAEGRVDTLCGVGHISETTAPGDVIANPDGYYIRSLQMQISHGDPRIVLATGKRFHLCTRSAATPDMEAGRAMLLMEERQVKYLFVPTDCPGKPLNS